MNPQHYRYSPTILFARLTQAGVHQAMDPGLARGVRLTNIICFMFGITILLFAVIFAFLKIPVAATFSAFFSATQFFGIYCNHRGFTTISRVGLVATSTVFGVILCWMVGPESRLNIGFFCLIGLPVLVFESNTLIAGLIGIIASLSGYYLSEIEPAFVAEFLGKPTQDVSLVNVLVAPLLFMVVFFELYYLQHENSKIQAILRNTVKDLSDQAAKTEAASREKIAMQATLVERSRLASLGEMAGGIAHEINTPLAVIALRARHIGQLLQRTPLDHEKLKEFTAIIESTIERIAIIIKGLRTFSRASDQDPFVETDIRALILDALSLCQEQFKNSGVNLEVKNGTPGLTIPCRPVQIVQVLLNLLSNARQELEKSSGPKTVSIRTINHRNYIEIAVSDTGPGIPLAIRDKVLEPFFTTKPVGEGTGLGLSISRGIALSHNGTLYLDPQSQETRFVLQLPKKMMSAS